MIEVAPLHRLRQDCQPAEQQREGSNALLREEGLSVKT